METIEIDLAEYSKELLIGLIIMSNKRKETIEETIRYILTSYIENNP